ncbi:MAG: L-arabinose isomerase [Brevinema sp.]
MIDTKQEFWFIVGSQLLYGDEVLKTIEQRAVKIVNEFNKSKNIFYKIIYKETIKTSEGIEKLIKEANYTDKCVGIITWCHTFSPSKMWINGLKKLQKPWCHFATQYNQAIPNKEINMEFMNLNQSAHGDREHGFIGTRMRMNRKVIAGFWNDEQTQKRIDSWMRVAIGVDFSKNLKVLRFGDNMRDVAVTEGDKVEAQIKLGWEVNTWPVGLLVERMNDVSDVAMDTLFNEYKEVYSMNTPNIAAVKYQAKIEIAIEALLVENRCNAFSNTFQDLYGMEQLPGIATQNLMRKGYGYAGEGDWKTAAMTSIMKAMCQGKTGGTSFMEDYTYHLEDNKELTLGSHMLEICPTIANNNPKIEVYPLSIGDRNPPARLVFEGKQGDAIIVSLVDMGGRMRLICQEVQCVKPIMDMPNLPVARVMWKSFPDLYTGIECWILAGGAHHTVLSYDLTVEQIKDFAYIMDLEFVHLGKNISTDILQDQLFLMDCSWKLR